MIASYALLIVALVTTIESHHIRNLNDLQGAIMAGPNRKVGFTEQFFYELIKAVLPSIVEVVICNNHSSTCTGTDHMISLVNDGYLLAGLLYSYNHNLSHKLSLFRSTVMSPSVFLMAPDMSNSFEPTENSSRDLALALNAAIVRVQIKGIFDKLNLRHAFSYQSINTCKTETAFPVPNKSGATGLLRKVLDSKVFKISTTGFYLDPDNIVTPFWTAYLRAIFNEFCSLSGPDGDVYGDDIVLKGVTRYPQDIFNDILIGSAYATGPFMSLDANYRGSLGPCRNASDCRLALLAENPEVCQVPKQFLYSEHASTGNGSGRCTHPERARMDIFRISCTTAVVDYMFFTKKISAVSVHQVAPKYMAIGMGVPTLIAIFALTILSIMIYYEKCGKPFFIINVV